MGLGKLFYQLLQLLHNATIAKDHSNGKLLLAFQKKVAQLSTKDQSNGKLLLAFQKKVAQLSTFLRAARPAQMIRDKLQEVNVLWQNGSKPLPGIVGDSDCNTERI